MNIRELTILMVKNDRNSRLARGRRIFKEGYVKQVRSMVDAHYEALDIFGIVKSENINSEYETNISINIEGQELIYTECSCTDYENNSDFNSNYICKHIGATFYRFIELLEQKIKEEEATKNYNPKLAPFKRQEPDYAEMLLSDIDEDSKNKEKVELEVNLARRSYFRGTEFYEADFKIGPKKTYVLKSIADFINARITGNPLAYGKAFTYDPNIHYFSQEDERVIGFMEEYLGLNETLENNLHYRSSSTNIAKNKTLLVPQTALKRFLEAVSHKTINFSDKSENYLATVKKEDLPISFSLEEEGDGIKLSTDGSLPEPLNYKGDVFIHNKNFYLPSAKQATGYRKFYSVFQEKDNVVFKGEKKQGVFNKVLPVLDTISKTVKIDEKLKEQVVKEALKAEIYFDRDKANTWATIKLNYGDKAFDYFTGPKDDEYIVRDLNKESNIKSVLNGYNFFESKGKFIFTGDDEKLYEFLSNDLKEIKLLGEVFYSDRFKDRKIYATGAVKATISESAGNYLEFSFNVADADDKEIKALLKAFKEKRKFFKLKNESFIDLEDDDVVEFFNLLDTLATDNRINNNTLKVSRNRAMFMDATINEGNMSFIEGKDIVSHISESIKTLDKANFKLPTNLNANLRDYQLTGFKWFKTLSHYGFGGILADEMGLGKTLQTIAFLLSEKGKKSLVITPTSLIYNWKSEFEKFAPDLKVVILHGSKDERSAIMESETEYDVLLTTYGTLRNDFHWYKDKNFDICIIDEGQNIKNPLALSSEAVKDINAKVKFALTGTPIENSLVELWSLFDFVMPGYLYGRNRFLETFSGKQQGIQNLKKMIKPFILRRLKKDVMSELPDKIEKKFFVEMKSEQKKLYSAYVKDIKEKMEDKSEAKDKITIFSYLTKLRQLCLDPSVILDNYSGGSGKLDVARELIQESIEDGHKILLFSQFTSVLDSIKAELNGVGIDYYYLDGATKAQNRVAMVEEFNKSENIKVFLISLKAGGTGLNLTSADLVIHFDPWWNPAIEDQATDRAHRFGQKNVVEVVKLIAKGTIEEKIISLQESKKEMISQVMTGDYKDGGFLGSLNEDEIMQLFT